MSSYREDIDALQAALLLFARTMKRPQRWTAITSLARVDIDRPAAIIMQTLMLSHPVRLRIQDLADHLGIEAPSVTRKTQELELAGYLRRVPDPADRRAIGLQLTTRGLGVSRRLLKAQHENMSQVMRDWSAKDRQELIKLFERFSRDMAGKQEQPIKPKQEIST